MCECGEVEEVGRGRGESVHGEKERKGKLTQYESVRVQCERMRTAKEGSLILPLFLRDCVVVLLS